jgi:hypothetical protein
VFADAIALMHAHACMLSKWCSLKETNNTIIIIIIIISARRTSHEATTTVTMWVLRFMYVRK